MQNDDHRTVAVGLFNRCWELIETPELTVDEEVELLTAAFTSRWHWLLVGGTEQWVVSDWMVARAAATLGLGPLAVTYAARAHATLAPDSPAWLRASTAEGLALAHAVAGDLEEHARWCDEAEELLPLIEDKEERALIADQLESTRARGA